MPIDSSFFFSSPLWGSGERGLLLSLLIGWLLDLLLGDPAWLPHPVVWFGKAIAFCEHRLNHGRYRKLKGALVALTLIVTVFAATWFMMYYLPPLGRVGVGSLLVFFCLAGRTLRKEVRMVFEAVDKDLEAGRRQVARIVGRDTKELSAQEVRTAALETLAENLSDGVVAPLFWFALLGVPGMLAYKMVNTLDSMIGYRAVRYKDFGCWAAHIDDIANYIPARLTALLMIMATPFCPFGHLPRGGESLSTPPLGEVGWGLFRFVHKYGRCHASPNSGYPEASLAGILNCRFGGPHYYFGQLFNKPYIGENDRLLNTEDIKKAVRVNLTAEVIMILLVCCWLLIRNTL